MTDFYTSFNAAEAVQTTMQHVFSNFNLLKTSFAGESPTGEHGTIWYDTGDTTLKISGPAGEDGWFPIADLSSGTISLTDGNVLSEHINDNARKPSLVLEEAIAPTECTLRTSPSPVLPSWSGPPYRDPATYRYMVRFPKDVGTIYMRGRGQGATASFSVAGVSSGTISLSGTGWTETSVDTLQPSVGWYELRVVIGGTIGASYVHAICFGV